MNYATLVMLILKWKTILETRNRDPKFGFGICKVS